MTDTISLDITKEITAFKIKDNWHGALIVGECIHVVPTPCDTAIHAANKARQLKKEMSGQVAPVKKKKVVKKKQPSKIKRKEKLYAEEEMQQRTDLAFKEVWIIQNIENKFVSSSLTNKTLATYSDDRDEAEIFNTYEEASVRIKTLNSCVKCGHKARRFFIEQDAN